MNDPFIASLHLPLEKIWDAPEVPTAATDGKSLYINSAFFLKLTPPQRETMMAHEGLHPVLGHCTYQHDPKIKAKYPNAVKANIAQDHAINLMLAANGYAAIPDWYCDPLYQNMSWEQIYMALPDDDSGGGQRFSSTCPFPDGQPGAPWQDALPSPDDLDPQATNQEMKGRLANAEANAKKAGKLDTWQSEMVDDALKSKINWKTALQNMMDLVRGEEVTWATPNRKYISMGLYMPSYDPEPKMRPVFIVADSSGSTSRLERSQFWSETMSIMKLTNPEKIHFAWCSTRLGKIHEFDDSDRIPDEPVEVDVSGGTRFNPVFDYIEKNRIDVACVIYLTDGDASSSFPAPNYPVIWVTTDTDDFKFGTSIKMEVNHDG